MAGRKIMVEDRNFKMFDFCKKYDAIIDRYANDVRDDDGTLVPFYDQAAIITHYMQLKGTPYEVAFKNDAERFMKLWERIIDNHSI